MVRDVHRICRVYLSHTTGPEPPRAVGPCTPFPSVNTRIHKLTVTLAISSFFRNVLLCGCGWGISLVFALPQVITLYLISGKWLVYFGHLALLPKCLWKEGNVHLGFVCFLNLVKPHLALYEQLQNASIVIKYKIHVLIMFLRKFERHKHKLEDRKVAFFLKEFQLGKGFFYISQINWKTWILASSSFYHVTAGSQRSEKFGCRPRWIFFFYSRELLWG